MFDPMAKREINRLEDELREREYEIRDLEARIRILEGSLKEAEDERDHYRREWDRAVDTIAQLRRREDPYG